MTESHLLFDPALDHLVLGASSLDAGIEWVNQHLGVTATVGGTHPSWGTRNALVYLGPQRYLEILAPDETQVCERRFFDVDQIESPRLVGWATNRVLASEVDEVGRPVIPGRRDRSDGSTLRWRLTDPFHLRAIPSATESPSAEPSPQDSPRIDALTPFFIDWTEGTHPADDLQHECKIVRLVATHPDPNAVMNRLRQLGVHLEVCEATFSSLSATIESPLGRVTVT